MRGCVMRITEKMRYIQYEAKYNGNGISDVVLLLLEIRVLYFAISIPKLPYFSYTQFLLLSLSQMFLISIRNNKLNQILLISVRILFRNIFLVLIIFMYLLILSSNKQNQLHNFSLK